MLVSGVQYRDSVIYIHLYMSFFQIFFPYRLSESEVAQSCPTLCDLMDCSLQTVAYNAPLSLGFSRQEYWSGLPFPSPIGYYKILNIVSYAIYVHVGYLFYI